MARGSNGCAEARRLLRRELQKRYGEKARQIEKGDFWIGQTSEEVVAALGEPLAARKQVLKTKKKEVLEYDRIGKNRFGTVVQLENNVAVGWDRR